jgi:AraC-like DNA-binding protein
MVRIVEKERVLSNRHLRAVDDYIRAHLEDLDRLSERKAARIASVSLGHLSRLFHAAGTSFSDWHSSVRTENAKWMIAQGASLQRAARSVGYERYETFCRTFKRLEGMSPTQFRSFVLDRPECASLVCSHAGAEFAVKIVALAERDPKSVVLLQGAAATLLFRESAVRRRC